MIPQLLADKLCCIECSCADLQLNEDSSELSCPECQSRFPVHDGIPSMMAGGPANQDWNPWDLDKTKMMGNSYYKRSTGELPEKEASKSFANLLLRKNLYTPGSTFLDIGCATGHFLKSFRRIVDPEFHYTGVDVTASFLQWGKEIFGLDDTCNFIHCDALQLPVQDDSFDFVIVNLFHFFPNVQDALKESFRVAKKRVIWRTPIGETNYVIKMIFDNDFEQVGLLTLERSDLLHSLYIIYSEQYIKGLIESMGARIVFFEQDTDFEAFDNTELTEMQNFTATKTVNGMQINGNIILDWHYIGMDVSG